MVELRQSPEVTTAKEQDSHNEGTCIAEDAWDAIVHRVENQKMSTCAVSLPGSHL